MAADGAHFTATDNRGTGGRLQQAGDQFENGGLAAAAGADQGNKIALVDAQGGVVQRHDITAVTHGHVGQLDHRTLGTG